MKKWKYLLAVLLIFVLAILLSSSYALLTSVVSGQHKYVMKIDGLNLVIDDSGNLGDVLVSNARPVTDEIGLQNESYDFSVINNENYEIGYSVFIVLDEIESPTPDTAIKINYARDYLGLENTSLLSDLGDGNKKLLDTGVIAPLTTYNYSVKFWIDMNAGSEILGTTFSCYIEVEAVQQVVTAYQDKSGANSPQLDDNMIPVKWENNNWVKASETEEWYNYDKQWWANAVTVVSSKFDTYNSAKAGTIILADDIETSWVWIPKYEYKISSTVPSIIDINFVNKDSSGNDYILPSAFSGTNANLSGIWVGKFESSSSDLTGMGNGGGSDTTLDVRIRPNVIAWREIGISDILTVVSKMSSVDNIYGFDSNSVDIHLIKNSEWGVITYLSHSKYGKYGNSNYLDTEKEVLLNSSYAYITGNASHGSSYYTVDGMKSSTTGNVYGIYDMSGGAFEFVMANYNKSLNNVVLDSNWFDNNTNLYDLYTSENITNACNGSICYGHALSETNGWYEDNNLFVTFYSSWLIRGGAFFDGSKAGIFAYGSHSGGPDYNTGFRVAMAVLK